MRRRGHGTHRGLAVVALALLLGVAAPSLAGYDDDLARAEALASEGRHREAASALEALAREYPQDFRLTLRLAQVRYEAGDMEGAEEAFRRAVILSGGARETRLGLGWTLLALERDEQAAEVFRAVLEEHPRDGSARSGLEAATVPAVRWTPTVAFVGQAYPDDPAVPRAYGVALGLHAQHRAGFLAGAVYRATWYETEAESFGGGRRRRTSTGYDLRHEAWATAGWAREIAGIAAHVGHVGDGGPRPGGTVGGLSARWSPWGDLVVEGSWGAFDDLDVVRGALAWRMPLGAGLSITPGGAVQGADGDVLGSGFATLAWQGEVVSLRAGGKLGLEERPTYLGQSATWNLVQRIEGGAHAGVSVRVAEGWHLSLDYEVHLLEATPDVPAGAAHLGTLAITGML
ncbi:MAG: tetratricopeptide repeat protein [Myxococcota bacterium]